MLSHWEAYFPTWAIAGRLLVVGSWACIIRLPLTKAHARGALQRMEKIELSRSDRDSCASFCGSVYTISDLIRPRKDQITRMESGIR
jgi:hypothetical protein